MNILKNLLLATLFGSVASSPTPSSLGRLFSFRQEQKPGELTINGNEGTGGPFVDVMRKDDKLYLQNKTKKSLSVHVTRTASAQSWETLEHNTYYHHRLELKAGQQHTLPSKLHEDVVVTEVISDAEA
ncbi:hypothetical protein PCANC_16673 [Puccinia coronata f. sp. avenae]|uniref:Uncharacterized protein n=1 Tax=Puccinia coronata f. sp. avenae TaxID=200324 RepID=A0A2N5SD48_9BASI|nr:hypothetical protein PCANC_23631 [Puccinia coronata f. sp. avenae]PLW36144.1 hypothetical protein PCANC_16673 [Puccinia coronata f. sp. avenae]